MTEEQLKQRTKRFALRVIKLVDSLPPTTVGRAIASQLIRSGTSVGANYRSACGARSRAEFISKLGTVREEADESIYWLELIIEAELLKRTLVQPLLNEANELTAIFTASLISVKKAQNDRNKS